MNECLWNSVKWRHTDRYGCVFYSNCWESRQLTWISATKRSVLWNMSCSQTWYQSVTCGVWICWQNYAYEGVPFVSHLWGRASFDDIYHMIFLLYHQAFLSNLYMIVTSNLVPFLATRWNRVLLNVYKLCFKPVMTIQCFYLVLRTFFTMIDPSSGLVPLLTTSCRPV